MRVLKCDICGDTGTIHSDNLIELVPSYRSDGIEDACRNCYDKIKLFRKYKDAGAMAKTNKAVHDFILGMKVVVDGDQDKGRTGA